MTDYQKTLRNYYDVDNFMGRKIESIEEGRTLVENIDKMMIEIINYMRDNDLNNSESDAYMDVRYDLNTARKRIQGQVGAFVKLKMKNRS